MDASHDCSYMLVIESGAVRVQDEEGDFISKLGRGDCLAEWSLVRCLLVAMQTWMGSRVRVFVYACVCACVCVCVCVSVMDTHA
eukprot:2607938-Rhodomonas_salina.1